MNDLVDFLLNQSCNYLNVDQLSEYNRILVLLYADDTVVLAYSAEEIQKYLDSLKSYCDSWKLTVNEGKTKVCIFSKSKCNIKFLFSYAVLCI